MSLMQGEGNSTRSAQQEQEIPCEVRLQEHMQGSHSSQQLRKAILIRRYLLLQLTVFSRNV